MTEHTPPKKIYLQATDAEYWQDTTWCDTSINDDDIEYIRADIANDLLEALEDVLDAAIDDYYAEHDCVGVLKRAYKAIAKARGDQ